MLIYIQLIGALPPVSIRVFFSLKGRDPIKKLITQHTKAPYIHTRIMFYTLHCCNIKY